MLPVGATKSSPWWVPRRVPRFRAAPERTASRGPGPAFRVRGRPAASLLGAGAALAAAGLAWLFLLASVAGPAAALLP